MPKPFVPSASDRLPRITIFAVLLFGLFAALQWRLVQLQVFRHEELQARAEDYRFTTRIEQSWRGQIQDRTGMPLALTKPLKNVYADLLMWTNRVELLAPRIAPLLGMDQALLEDHVQQRLSAYNRRSVGSRPRSVLVQRGVTPAKWSGIKEALSRETFGLQTNNLSSRQRTLLKSLRRWSLHAEDDQGRYFPHGESLSQVIGYVGTGTNGHLLQGKWGIEAFWDKVLAGQNSVCQSSKDAAGNELAFCRTTNIVARDGAHIVLTIDLTLQKIVERALAKAAAHCAPSHASCVVIRPATGEILALACWPSFAPQDPAASQSANWRNHVISDRYEVGSVFKVITLAIGLDIGVVNLDQRIFCENGRWVYRNCALHDNGHRYGYLTVRDCLVYSTNIGLAKIALMIGTNELYAAIINFGFDRPTGVPLPYETPGFVRHPTNWWAGSITRLAIGHELAVSQMQLAMAYAAIANDGRLMRPMLVRELHHADGTFWGSYEPKLVRSVVRPSTARLVRGVLRDAVERGTGKLAAMPQHSVAGKTGTAQKSDGRRIIPGRVYCSFVGMVPAERPELVIAVAVDEPQSGGYGGTIAAPVFREIAEAAVAHYGIPPDKRPGSSPQAHLVRNAAAASGEFAFAQ